MSAAPSVWRTKGSSHTAILLSLVEGAKGKATYIPMDSLTVVKASSDDFRAEWEPFEAYPVKRAAELYIGTTTYREMSPAALEQLRAILGNDKLSTTPALSTPTTANKETSMATAKTAKPAATSKVGTSKTATKATSAPAKTKVVGKTEQPAKAVKPAGNGISTIVSQSSKKAAPAKTAAPAKKAAPAKTAAPTATKSAGVPRVSPNADQKLTVAEPDKARRGVTQEFVNEAVKLKSFTRQQLLDVMVKKGHEEKAARIKIADCVYFKVFEAA